MTKTLFLHVGMPKCASSTLQIFLADHAATLAAKGIFYDTAPGETGEFLGNATALRMMLAEKQASEAEATIDHFLRRDGDVILSSEIFVALARHPHVKPLIEAARQRGFDIRLICFFRRQDLWIESDFKQHVKSTSPWTGDMTALIARRRRMRTLDYAQLMENWARFIGTEAITVVPLNPGQDKGHVIRRFLAFLGREGQGLDALPAPESNASPHPSLIEPARHIKRALLAQGMSALDVSSLLHAVIDRAAGRLDLPPRRFLMTEAERRALVAEYAASNDRLAQRFLGGQAAFDDTFAPDMPAAGDAPEGLPESLADEAARLLIAILNGEGALAARLGQGPGAAAAPGWLSSLRRRLRR